MADPVLLNGVKGTADLFGISSLTAPFLAETLTDVLMFLAKRQPFNGLPLTNGSEFQQQDDGKYVITAKYEGIPPEANPNDVASVEWSFDGNEDKEPVKTHPQFLPLKEKFGWDEENQEFPEIAPETASEEGLPGDDSSSDSEEKLSPLAGTNSWVVVGAEYQVTFVSRTVAPSITAGLGAIVGLPPGIQNFNLQLGKRNFLKLTPRIAKRGNVAQITLRYRLSGPRGIPKELYSKGQLDGESGEGSEENAINQPITLF